VKPATAWLVCYDIAEPRRLARVGRAAREFAVPLQYSVLWARLDGVGLGTAMTSASTRCPKTCRLRGSAAMRCRSALIWATRCCAGSEDRWS
jgi:hypothetical protein